MKWDSDLPENWDDAPANPPEVETPELEIVAVNGGAVARPTEEPDDGNVGTNSVFSSEVEDLEAGELHQWESAADEFDD